MRDVIDITHTALLHDTSTSGSYNYYGYVKSDGTWYIMREKTDLTEYRFALGSNHKTAYATAFAGATSLTYLTIAACHGS